MTRTQSLYRRLNQPLDIAALAMFRILFGTLMCVGTLRFMACDWIELFYVQPTFHFKYWGFEWVQVPGELGLYLLYGGIALTAALVALGAFYRLAIIGFWCLFTYAELMDVTYYLNHYYFVSLLALILCFLSPHRAWSVDAWRKPALQAQTLPAWQTWWLRFQVGLLYLYAGLAKFESDWLLHAQPLNIWLPPLGGMPLLGPFLEMPWVHFAFSWFAFLFDTFIIAFMLMRRTRLAAFGVILLFHLFTHLFFNIGLFPLIMVFAVLVFFEPDWPRKIAHFTRSPRHSLRSFLAMTQERMSVIARSGAMKQSRNAGAAVRRSPRPHTAPLSPSPSPSVGRGEMMGWQPHSALFALAIGGFCLVQFLMPLRHWAYPGNVLWNEEGMRFSWRVMLREKSGSLQYRVVDGEGQTWIVPPLDYLNELQYREMVGQPDLILQLAQHIRDEYNQRGHGPVQVYADALVSLNGRAAQPMINPQANLAEIRDGLARADWITPAPATPPPLHKTLTITARR